MVDTLIIGGGPAGVTCALWLKMLGHTAAIIEKRETTGGLQNDSPYLNQWIPVLPVSATGIDAANAMHNTMLHHQIPLHLHSEVVDVQRVSNGFVVSFVQYGQKKTAECKYIVIASGVRAASGGIRAAKDILIGAGGHIADSDVNDKAVAILGGGDNAFENYLFLKSRGAKVVKIFARSLRARIEFIDKVPADDITIGCASIDTVNKTVNGTAFDKLMIFYGWEAHLPFMRNMELAINERGFVVVNNQCETSQSDIYAIGETVQRMHPCCITSMADGVTAAKAIQYKLELSQLKKITATFRRAKGMI